MRFVQNSNQQVYLHQYTLQKKRNNIFNFFYSNGESQRVLCDGAVEPDIVTDVALKINAGSTLHTRPDCETSAPKW